MARPLARTLGRPLARPLGWTLAWTLAAASPAGAQEVRIRALHLRPGHDLLGDPPGLGAAVGLRVVGRVGVRVGVASHGERFRGFGTTCAGLLPAVVDCSAEPWDERARIRTLALWGTIDLISSGRVGLAVLPGVRAARVESDQVGVWSGRTRGADKAMYGYELGVEGTLVPPTGSPFRVHLGAHVGTLRPPAPERIADGYAPFEDDFGFTRVELGISLAR